MIILECRNFQGAVHPTRKCGNASFMCKETMRTMDVQDFTVVYGCSKQGSQSDGLQRAKPLQS